MLDAYGALQRRVLPAFITMCALYLPMAALGTWLKVARVVPALVCTVMLALFFLRLLALIARVLTTFRLDEAEVEVGALSEDHIAALARSSVILPSGRRGAEPAPLVEADAGLARMGLGGATGVSANEVEAEPDDDAAGAMARAFGAAMARGGSAGRGAGGAAVAAPMSLTEAKRRYGTARWRTFSQQEQAMILTGDFIPPELA